MGNQENRSHVGTAFPTRLAHRSRSAPRRPPSRSRGRGLPPPRGAARGGLPPAQPPKGPGPGPGPPRAAREGPAKNAGEVLWEPNPHPTWSFGSTSFSGFRAFGFPFGSRGAGTWQCRPSPVSVRSARAHVHEFIECSIPPDPRSPEVRENDRTTAN